MSYTLSGVPTEGRLAQVLCLQVLCLQVLRIQVWRSRLPDLTGAALAGRFAIGEEQIRNAAVTLLTLV